MRNYAGHRLSPWLGHLMVSRQETARPLLTPGEVMQLPADDELVLVSGMPPIRAKKVRYYRGPAAARPRPAAARSRPQVATGRRHRRRLEPAPAPPMRRPSRRRRRPGRRPRTIPRTAASAASRSCPSMRRSPRSGRAVAPEFDVRARIDAGRRRRPRSRQLRATVPQRRAPGRARSRRRHRALSGDAMRTKHRLSSASTVALKRRSSSPRGASGARKSADRRGRARLLPVAGRRRAAGGGDRPPARPADPAGRAARARRQPSPIEALALFVRFWLTTTPPLPDTRRPPRRPRAASGTRASSRRSAGGSPRADAGRGDLAGHRAGDEQRPSASAPRAIWRPPFACLCTPGTTPARPCCGDAIPASSTRPRREPLLGRPESG